MSGETEFAKARSAMEIRTRLDEATTPPLGRSVVIVTTTLLTVYDDLSDADTVAHVAALLMHAHIPGMQNTRLGGKEDIEWMRKPHPGSVVPFSGRPEDRR